MQSERGIVPEYRSIAKPQTWLGLPPAYGCILLMAASILALSFGMWRSALIGTLIFYSIGLLVTWYDPYGWSLFGRMSLVPRILKP